MTSFAYLFERFPSFVQTFVYREAAEMVRQGMAPWLVSIRRPDDAGDLAEKLGLDVFYAPAELELRTAIAAARASHQLSWAPRWALLRHGKKTDFLRLFEAIWLAPHLKARGIRHVHAHYGGMAARTAWWLRKLFGFTYSFTGHANDIFCDASFPVSNSDLVRDAEFVVTETDYARRWMEEKHPRAKGKVFRVFNGIDLDGFPAPAPRSGPPKIISVGRCVEKKGFGDLIEACRLLRARGVAFECEIVGDGPLKESLEAQVARDGLVDAVRLLGPKPQSEVRRLLSEASVFALACVPEAGGGSDNLPTVIMEAMACGVPVVSTTLAGVPEMVVDGGEGFLVAPKSPPALAGAIEKLLADPALAARVGGQGRASARANFAIENTTRALKHLLVKCAGITPPGAARVADPEMPAPSFLDQSRKIWR